MALLLAMLAPLVMAGSCTTDVLNAVRTGALSFTTATVVTVLNDMLPVADWLRDGSEGGG
jgi:predicted secreted protein